MQVDGDLVTLEGDGATQLQLLTDLGGELVESLLGGLAVDGGGGKLLSGVGLGLGGGLGDTVRESDEFVGLGDEVGLRVDLDHGGAGNGDQALGGGALGALSDVLGTLDTQDLDGLLEVALGLVQSLLAGHHAGAGELAELLDISSGVVRHVRRSSLYVVGRSG